MLQINLHVLSDPNIVNATLIRLSERGLRALLIPLLSLKAALLPCCRKIFIPLLLSETKMPVAYFQLMHSRVPEAHCVSCRQSFQLRSPLLRLYCFHSACMICCHGNPLCLISTQRKDPQCTSTWKEKTLKACLPCQAFHTLPVPEQIS